MKSKLQVHSLMSIDFPHISLENGMRWGMIGGLAGTVIMDFLLICAFLIAGMPPFTCFSIVGDTMERVLSFQGIANSAALGAAAHYLVGPVLGALFGAAARFIPALQRCSWKKAILFAVLYAEIVSQPLLALTPIFLRMTSSELLLWYGGSFGMHFIWGCILGAVWSLGGQQPVAKNHR